MIFRDGCRSNLPHKSLSEKEINLGRLRDKDKKINKKNDHNSSRLTKSTFLKSAILFLLKTTKDVQSLTHIFYQKSFV